MKYPTYHCNELKDKPLESLYHKLMGYRVKKHHLRAYEDFVRTAKKMAERGQISGSIEIRLSGIYSIRGFRGDESRTKIA